jgi:hypothetical protein
LKYREFEPFTDDDDNSDMTQMHPSDHEPKTKPFWKRLRGKEKVAELQENEKPAEDSKEEKPPHVEKKVPVIFFDEAHKLYAQQFLTLNMGLSHIL